VTGGAGKVTSSAVVVRSWALSLNRHLGEGQELGELPIDACLEATYLPTRFLLVPVKALREGHFPAEAQLPHYCADYEYTNRLRRAGYAPILFTGAHAALVEENTGFDTFLTKTSLWSRHAEGLGHQMPLQPALPLIASCGLSIRRSAFDPGALFPFRENLTRDRLRGTEAPPAKEELNRSPFSA
jgi:hypothetical protein